MWRMTPPRLQGAKKVQIRLTNKHHADLDEQIEVVKDAWDDAHRILERAGGLCGCGRRWGHMMNGMNVTLLDKAPYTARCWDDDRLLIHLKKFSEEEDGGVGVLVHEFGHRVWFQCLTDEQREAWRKGYTKLKSNSRPRWGSSCGGVVSEYACTDDLEDFAETYRMIVYGQIDKRNLERWLEVCDCGCDARSAR